MSIENLFHGFTGGGFGAESAVSPRTWPVGINNGIDGADVIEGFVSLADLAAGAIVRVAVVAEGDGSSGALVSRDGQVGGAAMWLRLGGPALAPVASHAGLAACVLLLGGVGVWALRRRGLARAMLVLLAVAGTALIAWAVTIVMDGQVNDWAGIPALGVHQPCGSGSDAAAEIAALFATTDAVNLYIRIDVCDLVVTPSTPTPSPSVTPTPTPTQTATSTPNPCAGKADGTTCDAGTDSPHTLICVSQTCGQCSPDSSAVPRFVDNGNGTITYRQTCLVWKKQGADGSVFSGGVYPWAGICSVTTSKYCQPSPAAKASCETDTAVGTVGCDTCNSGEGTCNRTSTIWTWLNQLNNLCANGTTDCTTGGDMACAGIGNGKCGFAGYRNWRIPKLLPATPSQGTPAAFEADSLIKPSAGSRPYTYSAFNTGCPAGCTPAPVQLHWSWYLLVSDYQRARFNVRMGPGLLLRCRVLAPQDLQ